MIEIDTIREMALSFEKAEEHPHFHKTSFRVKKKIFATLDIDKNQVVVKLSKVDQSVFSRYDDSIIYPVDGAWGRQGWTIIELDKVGIDLFRDAITTAYCEVAPDKLANKYRHPEED